MAESWLPLLTTTWRAGVDEPHQALREQLDGLGRGHRPVVDVAADEHGVDPLGAHDVDEVVEVGGLGVEQPHLVERAPQVPVGGVDQPHGDPRYERGATPPVTETRFRATGSGRSVVG